MIQLFNPRCSRGLSFLRRLRRGGEHTEQLGMMHFPSVGLGPSWLYVTEIPEEHLPGVDFISQSNYGSFYRCFIISRPTTLTISTSWYLMSIDGGPPNL
jgi:hypothetical protein